MRNIQRNYHLKVAQIIEEMEAADDTRQIKNIEPCEGTENAFRIRMGDYRIGVYIEKVKKVNFTKIINFYNFHLNIVFNTILFIYSNRSNFRI